MCLCVHLGVCVCVALYDAHVSLGAASVGMVGYGKGTGLDVLVKDGCGWRGLGLWVYRVPSCTAHPVAHKNLSDLCRTSMCVDRAIQLC